MMDKKNIGTKDSEKLCEEPDLKMKIKNASDANKQEK